MFKSLLSFCYGLWALASGHWPFIPQRMRNGKFDWPFSISKWPKYRNGNEMVLSIEGDTFKWTMWKFFFPVRKVQMLPFIKQVFNDEVMKMVIWYRSSRSSRPNGSRKKIIYISLCVHWGWWKWCEVMEKFSVSLKMAFRWNDDGKRERAARKVERMIINFSGLWFFVCVA